MNKMDPRRKALHLQSGDNYIMRVALPGVVVVSERMYAMPFARAAIVENFETEMYSE